MFLRQEAWTRFADREGLVLVSPSFHTDLDEIHSGKGYYYPKLWSGQVTLDALKKIGERIGARTDKILMFGFSAGAHFTHRFALWQPDKVKAFVAYSAGWWDEPTGTLESVPALIMCGEKDERYEPTLAFLQRGLALHLPWVWRSYSGVDHVITPEVVAMAQAFLAHYARGEKDEPFAGDLQSYQYFEVKSAEAGRLPEELRVTLPSRAVAEAWKQETHNKQE
jgi:pimeloyl-ACP methyl ester carboxylesterase